MGFFREILNTFFENTEERKRREAQEAKVILDAKKKQYAITEKKHKIYFSDNTNLNKYLDLEKNRHGGLFVKAKFFPDYVFEDKSLLYKIFKQDDKVQLFYNDRKQIMDLKIYAKRDTNKFYQSIKKYANSNIETNPTEFFNFMQNTLEKCFDEKKALSMLAKYEDFIEHIDKSIISKEDFIYKAINVNVNVIKPLIENDTLSKDMLLKIFEHSIDKKIFKNDEIFYNYFINNKDVLLEVCKENKEIYENLPMQIYIRLGVEEKGDYEKFKDSLKNKIEYNDSKNIVKYETKESLIEGIKKYGSIECIFARDELLRDKDIAKDLLEVNKKVYEYLPIRLQENKDIAKIGIQDINNISFLPKFLYDDLLFMKQAVAQAPELYEFLKPTFKEDLALSKLVVERKSSQLEHTPKSVQDNFDIVFKSVQDNPKNIEFGSDRLKNNYEVALEIAKINGYYLKHINPKLLSDNLEIMYFGVKSSKATLSIIPDEYKELFGSTQKEFLKNIKEHIDNEIKRKSSNQEIKTTSNHYEMNIDTKDEDTNYQRQ